MKKLAQKHGHSNPHIIFCEVNDPSLISDTEDSVSPLSRLRAFQQMGVRQMESFSYVQPALEGQTERGRSMLLAVVVGPMTPRDEESGLSYVESEHVRAFLRDFYTDLDVANLDADADFQRMMDCLKGRDRVMLRDFDLARFKPAAKKKAPTTVVPASIKTATVPVHIVIVGAGVSGLACARMLRDAGLHVTILEGRNRIGGRVYTSRSFETRIDLGAAWLHGLEGNPLAELAMAELPSLRLHKNNEQAIILYDRDGRMIDSNIVFESYMKFVQMIDTLQSDFNPEERETDPEDDPEGFEMWKRTQPRVDQSLQDALKVLYAKHSKLRYTSEQEKCVMNFMFSQLESLQGAPMQQLNARDYAHGIEYEGGDHMVVSGFQNIALMLSAGLDCIQLGQKVERIEYRAPAPVALGTDRPAADSLPKVRVHVEKGGAPIDCHGVVVTSSIGVLHSGMTRFSPPLPRWKSDSIRAIGSGLFNKCVLRFEKSFWPASADYIGYNFGADPATPEDASLDAVHTARSNSWFVNYEPVAKVPIIIAMLTGPLAEAMEKLPDAEVVAEMMRRLRIMFGAAVPPAPVDALVTRWGADEYSRGSYSFLKKGASIEDFENAGKPVDNCLFWAGEHTSTDRFGYVDGAYVSGQREAKRIINLYSHLGALPQAKL